MKLPDKEHPVPSSGVPATRCSAMASKDLSRASFRSAVGEAAGVEKGGRVLWPRRLHEFQVRVFPNVSRDASQVGQRRQSMPASQQVIAV